MVYAPTLDYHKNTLTTYGSRGTKSGTFIIKGDNYQQNMISDTYELWGFRKLKQTTDEETGETMNPDAVKVRGDAPCLAVFADGNKKDGKGNQVYQVYGSGHPVYTIKGNQIFHGYGTGHPAYTIKGNQIYQGYGTGHPVYTVKNN